MALAPLIEPHSHDPIGRGVIKDFLGAPPIGLRPIALAVSTDEEADEEADHHHDDEN